MQQQDSYLGNIRLHFGLHIGLVHTCKFFDVSEAIREKRVRFVEMRPMQSSNRNICFVRGRKLSEYITGAKFSRQKGRQ